MASAKKFFVIVALVTMNVDTIALEYRIASGGIYYDSESCVNLYIILL